MFEVKMLRIYFRWSVLHFINRTLPFRRSNYFWHVHNHFSLFQVKFRVVFSGTKYVVVFHSENRSTLPDITWIKNTFGKSCNVKVNMSRKLKKAIKQHPTRRKVIYNSVHINIAVADFLRFAGTNFREFGFQTSADLGKVPVRYFTYGTCNIVCS